jgi:hypothetical protein
MPSLNAFGMRFYGPHSNQFKKPTCGGTFKLVGDEGLEPPTSSLSVTRSNQLS